MTQEQTTPLDIWAIVELFGHQKIAGRVLEVPLAGTTMLRVDVPASEQAEAFTRYYGAGAIYAITPVSEEVARAVARRLRVEPITVYVPELARPALPAATGGSPDLHFGPDDDDDDDFGPG